MGKSAKKKSANKASKSKALDGSPKAAAASLPSPPPRGITQLAGIGNQGATCFLSALLQCLVFIPEIRDAVFQLDGQSGPKDGTTSVALQLQLLFASLMLEQQQAVSSEGLTQSLGWSREQVRQQQDVHEAFMTLMGSLRESVRGTAGERLLHTLLHSTLVQKITCFSCERTSKMEVQESTIFLPVEGSSSLEDSLRNLYCSPEALVGRDRYTGCAVCLGPTNALKTTRMEHLPPVLTFGIKRFSLTPDGKAYKVHDMFTFPMELNMSPYTGCLPDPDLLYELLGVVVHSGSCDTGHYTACVQDIDHLGQWEMPGKDHGEKLAEVDKAVQVVATVLAQIKKKGPMVPVERLSGAVGKQTGLSWAKSYKKTLGSFTKFLETNRHTFVVEGNQVGLVQGPGPSSQRESGEAGGDTTGQRESGEAGGDTTAPRPASSSPGEENSMGPSHWHFFNDSHVSPMAEKDLAHFFEGKTSAYMLVYRRKNIARPKEAKNNPAFRIPLHLLEKIEEVNNDLERQRWDSNTHGG